MEQRPDLDGLVLPDLLTVEVLARHLGRGPAAVRALLRRKVLPGRRIGRRWIVERRALLRALAPDFVQVRVVRLGERAEAGARP